MRAKRIATSERITEIVNFAQDNGDDQACKTYGIKPESLFRYRRVYKNDLNPMFHDDIRVIKDAQGPNLSIVSECHQIRTLEQLLAYCKVDLKRWVVTRHVVNMWGSESNPNFQVKAWLTCKDQEVDGREEICKLIEDAKQYAPKYPEHPPYKKRNESGNLLEISLFDHHFGRMAWHKETRSQNYDVKISRELAISTIDYILSRAADITIDHILLPIGNDFFNVDNAIDTTARGTHQSEDDRWQKTFVRGRRLWVEIIERCLSIAPVTIKIISGNHDKERIFYLGDALECWFNKCELVTIDNSPAQRKYFEWGKCFIGFTHGHMEVKGSLINIMATEMPAEWARTKYREWHKGHLHTANAKAFQILDEARGVREWILPSLVALSDWEAGKGYAALRESIAMLWNRDMGKTDMFMYHPN